MAMATELSQLFLPEVKGLESGEKKGCGAYGAIFEVTVNSTPCIAKRLHDILVDQNYVNPRDRKSAQQKFQKECVLLSKLKHPNIVRLVGVHYGRNTSDLSLIMEKLHTDLDKYLETHPNIPLPVKLSILYDVSCGLLYLHEHSPPIIHRDLTARNILLTRDMQAKIADLGVSKLLDLHAQVAVAKLTKAPGQIFYMPPEALTDQPQYDTKLDTFSFGHLALYTVTQTFPQPDDSKITENSVRRGEMQIAKRETAIIQMGRNHCLYPLITQCLQDMPKRRPTARDLNKMIQKMGPRKVHLALRMNAMSEVIKPGPPAILKLPVDEIMKDPQNNIAMVHVSSPCLGAPAPDRVLMLVGATGAGKSTLINAIANYILGVQWEDDFRFELITNEGSESQAHSQTKWITAYTFHKRKGSPVPYTLTIIDTPGFGDTKGVERDKEITRQIKEFFSIPSPNGIDHIDGIGFVAQASLSRLTQTQRYIFDSILSIYGKDIADNIFMMFTFADTRKPRILTAIEAAKIPHRNSFKFNNSALKEDDSDSDDEELDKGFWKLGFASLKSFFNEFEKVESKSLQLTREVLLERQQLEVTIQGLQPQIRTGLSKIDVLRQEETVLKHHEAEMVKNENFTYTVTVTKQKKIDIIDMYVTNCLKCNCTCHFPCLFGNNKDKRLCAAMKRVDGSCTVCPLKCDWREHVNNPYRFELYEEEEERCFDDLKARYYEAREGKSAVETMIARMETELKELQMVVFRMIQDAQRSLKRLDEIALKPDPLSEVDYIDLLIESEIQQAELGWKKRVKSLKDIRERAHYLATVNDRNASVDTIEEPALSWWKKLVEKTV